MIKERSRAAKIWKPINDKDDGRLKKDNSLSPCHYQVEKGVEATTKKSLNTQQKHD